MMIYKIILIPIFLFILSCGSQSIIPSPSDIEVGRKVPSGNCVELGLLRGSTMTTSGTKEDALTDLKSTAAAKGATYIKVEQFSETGTSVTGIAYTCP